MESLALLERKDLPEHLMQCASVERPTMLRKLLIDLEDSGEAVCFFVFSVICRRIADYVIASFLEEFSTLCLSV